jgi:hypothetical protein
MRLGIVRDDVAKVYVQDVENTSQRNFSSQPKGQSRYFRKPTDAELAASLSSAPLSVRGSNTSATVNTSSNNVLKIRSSSSLAYTSITVTANAALAKTAIVIELNAAFTTNSLPFVASVRGVNQIQINSVGSNLGPSAALDIDATADGSSLNTAVGFTVGGTVLAGLAVSALKTAAYPTATTIDVSSATLVALSTFSLLTAGEQASLVDSIADQIAPSLEETGPVLLSFVKGTIAKLIDPSFQPGGDRSGLPAGVAAQALDDDGVTTFTL